MFEGFVLFMTFSAKNLVGLLTDKMDNHIIKNAFKPLINEHCWGVKKGRGSFLTFEFGQSQLEIGEPKIRMASSFPPDKYSTRNVVVHGHYHLWIYCCNWKIRIESKEIAFDESSDKEIENATDVLNGQKLLDVIIDTKNAVAQFKFDLQGELLAFNESYERGAEMWMLYLSEQTLTFNNLGRFCLANKDRDIKEEKFETVDSEIINITHTPDDSYKY